MTDCDCCCCHETLDCGELGSDRSALRTTFSMSNNTAPEALR